jgi:hypothetical protein
VSLAVFNLGQEGLWVAPVLCRPPIKCAVPSEWRWKVGGIIGMLTGGPGASATGPLAVPVPVPTPGPSVLVALGLEDQALLLAACPVNLLLLSVPGGTLEVLKHTPGVKKAWWGEGRGGGRPDSVVLVGCFPSGSGSAPQQGSLRGSRPRPAPGPPPFCPSAPAAPHWPPGSLARCVQGGGAPGGGAPAHRHWQHWGFGPESLTAASTSTLSGKPPVMQWHAAGAGASGQWHCQ